MSAAQLADALADALAAKADVNGDASEVFRAKRLFLDDANVRGVSGGDHSGALDNNDVYLMNWDSAQGAVALLSKEDPYFMRLNEWVKRTIWHSGNFDPTGFVKMGRYRDVYGGVDAIPFEPGVDANNISGIELCSTLTMPGVEGGYATQFRIRDYAGSLEASIRGEQSKIWRGLWHSGNFDPADYLHYAGGIPDDNMDNAVAPGIYSYGNVTINRPTSYGTLLVLVSPLGPWIVQLAFGTENQHTYYRRRTNWAAWTPWRMFYDSGNLGPASASADGLMSAADKQKLDSLSSARRCCGIIDSNGTFGGAAGVVSVTKQGPGKYMVTHNFNTLAYAVVATPFALWTGNDAADARFVCTIKQRLENHFTVHVFDINRNACVDQAFMFIVMPTA